MASIPVREVARFLTQLKLSKLVCPFDTQVEVEVRAGRSSSSMSVDSVFRTRSLGVAAEGLPDQYADGKAAKVWQLYIGDTKSRTQEYKSWVVSLLKQHGVRSVLDVACGTG